MNINDNQLNELMEKTHTTIKTKKRQRMLFAASSLGAFSILAAVLVFTVFINGGKTPDVTLENPTAQAATQNQPSPTPLPDGSTQNPYAGPTPEAFSQSVWDKWSTEGDVGGVQTNVALVLNTIALPQGTAYHTYDVGPENFDVEFAKKAAEYFYGDKYYKNVYTKSDYEKIYNAEKNAYESDTDLSDEEKVYVNVRLNEIKDWMEAAPENNSPADIAYDMGSIWIKGYTKDDAYSTIVIHAGDEEYGPSFAYYRGDLALDYQPAETLDGDSITSGTKTITLDEAEQKADDLVSYFTSDMIQSHVVIGHGYNPRGNAPTLSEIVADQDSPKCYIFYFTRKYPDGLYASAGDFTGNSLSSEILPPRAIWEEEVITVMVDAEGIFSMAWANRTQIFVRSDKAFDIISVDDAVAIFKENALNKKWNLNEGAKTDILINAIGLGMVKTATEYGQYTMVPAYIFIGTQHSTTDEGYEFTNYDETNNAVLYAINAIDGTIIK